MTESSELKSPFIEFDYNDDTKHDSTVKQGTLYTVRIQNVFDQLGELELTPNMVTFVREPHIRSRLEDIVKGKSKFSLTSPDLPFLMRAELVDAYFQHKISKHLQQFGEIEIYIAHMKTLGIDELRDKEQVTKAYHQAVVRDKAHPDLTQDPTEKIERGRRLNELSRARDELSHRLDLQSASPAYGVSMHIGNISAMLKSN